MLSLSCSEINSSNLWRPSQKTRVLGSKPSSSLSLDLDSSLYFDNNFAISSLLFTAIFHSPCSKRLKSQVLPEYVRSPDFFDRTVNLLVCANEAVFIPRPKRPKSWVLLWFRGDWLGSRIATDSSSSDMPFPLSAMKTWKGSRSAQTSISIAVALAEIELSIRSAREACNV